MSVPAKTQDMRDNRGSALLTITLGKACDYVMIMTCVGTHYQRGRTGSFLSMGRPGNQVRNNSIPRQKLLVSACIWV